jgi:hypothetical protein
MTRVSEQPPRETAAAPPPLPGPGRGRRAETAIRVALVLLLLGIAAQGLSGRRHLDWAAISDAPGSTWIGLVLIAAATFVVVASFRTLVRMLRATHESEDDDAPMAAIEGSRVTWLGYLAAAAVVAAAIFLVYLLVKSVVAVPLKFNDPGAAGLVGAPPHPSAGNLTSTDKWALLVAMLVGGGLALALMVLRSRAEPPEEETQHDQQDPQAALAEAVSAAEEVLDHHGDGTRAAIIAAYAAMERQLAASGTTRLASDTPSDFVLRALAASRVSRGAATRLTDLFREARFSRQPMAPTAREDAARALARVADDLAHDAIPRRDQNLRKPGPRG